MRTSSISFRSAFASDLRGFLACKRALGRSYDWAEDKLRSFDYVAAIDTIEHGGVACLKRAVERWLAPGERRVEKHGKRSWKGGRFGRTIRCDYSLIRQFCLYRRRLDPDAFVPESGRGRRVYRFCPYILSDDQIRALLRETQTLRGPNAALRRATFKTMTLVFYCTGLRPGEVPRLRLCDLDLRRRMFFIQHGKGRSRWVPFSNALARKIREYLALRLPLDPRSPESPLFVRPDGTGYRKAHLCWQFGYLFRRLGLKPLKGRAGPRLYDLRHVFATRRLTQWYREGVDLRARLPWLSAYMGHDSLLGTEVYLTATPELLRFASRRFASRFRGGLRE